MERKSKIVIFMMMMLMSLPIMARKLTTTQIRENTIRINALEIEEIDVTKYRAKGPDKVTVVLDARGLNFDFDKWNVKEEYYGILQNLIEYMDFNGYSVTLIGHTDSKGSDSYNMALGQKRAESVKAKLIEFGLSEDRILGTGSKGEKEPIATNDTEQGRFENRRIEFELERK